jgi:hypothetical protein
LGQISWSLEELFEPDQSVLFQDNTVT